MILTWENATTYSTCIITFTGIEIREINNEKIKFLCWKTNGSKIGLKEIAYGEKKDKSIGYLVLRLIVSDCLVVFTVTDIN